MYMSRFLDIITDDMYGAMCVGASLALAKNNGVSLNVSSLDDDLLRSMSVAGVAMGWGAAARLIRRDEFTMDSIVRTLFTGIGYYVIDMAYNP